MSRHYQFIILSVFSLFSMCGQPIGCVIARGEDSTSNVQNVESTMMPLFPLGSVSMFTMFYSLSIVKNDLPSSLLEIKAEFKVSHQKDAVMLQGRIMDIKMVAKDESVQQLKDKEFSFELFSKNNSINSSIPFVDMSAMFPQFVPLDPINWETNETIMGCPYALKNSSVKKKNGVISLTSDGIRRYKDNMERIMIGKMTIKRSIECHVGRGIPIFATFHLCTEKNDEKIISETKINLLVDKDQTTRE